MDVINSAVHALCSVLFKRRRVAKISLSKALIENPGLPLNNVWKHPSVYDSLKEWEGRGRETRSIAGCILSHDCRSLPHTKEGGISPSDKPTTLLNI